MKKIGKQTYKIDGDVSILSTACIAGPKEKAGPLSKYFDQTVDDEFWGEETWEKAESKFIKETAELAINKSGIPTNSIDFCFAGDLINQCTTSSFGLMDLNIPYFGVFGACSTFVETNLLGSSMIDGGFAQNVLCACSSHFCSAEKQFRFPLELGNQRPPSAQWTVTAAGASVLTKDGNGPFIRILTPGKIVDMGIKDAANMGAAMAGAALDTLVTHFNDTGRTPDYYDMIFTGDLGYIGKDILIDLSRESGFDISNNYDDCGVLIFDKKTQDTHSGGSGCGCVASVFGGYIYNQLKSGQLKKILLIATGALTNALTTQQGQTIPGIAHAISIEV